MKIEWLNEERTKARLCAGWFRKRFTHVFKDAKSDNWGYQIDNQEVPVDLRNKLNKARRWQPMAKLPEAKVVK